jgi:Subtilase family
MTLNLKGLRTLALLALAAGHALLWAQTTKPRIDKAADLPRFSYRIEGKLEDMVRNAERFAPFAAAVRKDLEGVVNGYDIADKAAQRDLLVTLALLDFLDARYEQAFNRAEQVRSLQDKPADKLISSLRLRAASQAARSHALGSESYKKAVAETIAAELAKAPYAVIENDVRELKASAELIGEALILGRIREVMQPIVDKGGVLSSEFAPGVISARYALLVTLPLKATFTEAFTTYLAAHKVVKNDIWAARDVTLDEGARHTPVTVAVWDSGVDTQLFGKQVRRGAHGAPLVIAFDKYSRAARGELQPISKELQARLPAMKSRTKGLSDMQSNIDSAEASEVKAYLSTLAPDQYKTAMEELNLAGNYMHGTHVAGITMQGNPYARLLVARIEFGHTLKPDPCPSLEQAFREARAHHAYVGFMKKHGVRVVNMSWGGNVTAIEGDLEQCGIGADPQARKVLARRYFEIGKKALTQAMAKAPGMLFITAAGNSGNDASFIEDIPAGIVLRNLLTVGAVDLAGDEAGFTSYGPTVKVHANGYQVVSFIPGGERIAISGTSMASPQVANLAAKMLAVNPKLTPARVIKIIRDTAESSADGRRHLIHPKKAIAAARR